MLFKVITLSFLLGLFSNAFAVEVPIYEFPIKSYDQDIDQYVPKNSPDYSKPLLTSAYQSSQLAALYRHYYASDKQGLSPWSEEMINALLPYMKKIEVEILNDFDNQNKPFNEKHYAENFKEHDEHWLNKIKQNMQFSVLTASKYNPKHKAIAVANTFARALPDAAPDFFHFSLPGQGFPFDNLQESIIWAGTPLYVFSTSQDKAWMLVLTPDAYFAWVKTNDVAYVNREFITKWQTAAQKKLIAVTKTEASIINQDGNFELTSYIGAVFPLDSESKSNQTISIYIPIKNKHHMAEMATGIIDENAGAPMPLRATKENMASLIKQLQNRPYGWGGAFYFNDCSQEMKSIFTPFGIWLPRNSERQARLNPVDLSKQPLDERIDTLKKQGHPLMTLIYIGGHVMLYTGTHEGANHEIDAMTYQNVWGLTPANRDKRYVIGQSLFLPLLKYYPENPDINSMANRPIFKLIYLDHLDENTETSARFAKEFTKTSLIIE